MDRLGSERDLFKIGEIRELIRLIDETSVTEVNVENGDAKLVIKKASEPAPTTQVPYGSGSQFVVETIAEPVAPRVAAAPTVASEQGGASATELEQGVVLITSPMVGTFYRAASPELGPYVEKGAAVTEKTVVCIVEAMKLMNEIEAEVRGEVVDVLVDNGQLVEYGQPLFKIKLS